MKLRRLSNDEYDDAAAKAAMSGHSLEECPTCGSRPERTDDPDTWGRASMSMYRFRGQMWPCDCQRQRDLHKHYLVANIGVQFQRLNWNDYDGSPAAKKGVELYLSKWESFKRNGMGLEFSGSTLGTGKTFAATHVAKELIKRGERVLFIPFLEVISTYQASDAEQRDHTLKSITVLVLDEVVPPGTQAQGGLFAAKFEELIRHRTNYNLPTIMTTNLDPQKLLQVYPRPYSLLEAKQMRIEVEGPDARMSWLGNENLEIANNEEVRPIT